MELFILRHAQSTANVVKRGSLYIPDNKAGKALQKIHPSKDTLTDFGIEQASRTGEKMAYADMHFDKVFCSTHTRTRQTLDMILHSYEVAGKTLTNARIDYDICLREIEFGSIAQMTKDEAKHYFPWFTFHNPKDWFSKPELRENWFYARTPIGGESYADVANRVKSFLMELSFNVGLDGEPDAKILLVTHGGVTRTIRFLLEGLTPEEFDEKLLVWRFNNCAMIYYKDFKLTATM